MRVLIIEDDRELAAWLQETFEKAIGTTDSVGCLDEARAALAVSTFDLVVVDRRLPDGDGLSLLPELKALQPQPATLMLTALDDPEDIAAALDRGADEYVGKPFEPAELIARARAVLRRFFLDKGTMVQVGNLRFDVVHRSAFRDGEPLLLPRRELAILELLIRRVGRVVLRESLEASVYGFDDEIQSNALDSHVSRLRRKLREAQCSATIKSVRGVGYLMSAQ
ncbi:response regulator transcription factor [Chelatococcus sp. SYSU_G07232]|uniref:Response regulator transcription factor n=1 Tax=Chelatococcus albus TaxID=3047466 RepID=A0ABT7AHR3_9HYPH|nr:response regulator transcription factor [Chelatococcus sp. SYSU_G07232]MDJ1158925.1 response regulator transcription factor [Chelatococcus sp. SYSU_G07232]